MGCECVACLVLRLGVFGDKGVRWDKLILFSGYLWGWENGWLGRWLRGLPCTLGLCLAINKLILFSGCLGYMRQPETLAKIVSDGALKARRHPGKPAILCLISQPSLLHCRFQAASDGYWRQPETVCAWFTRLWFLHLACELAFAAALPFPCVAADDGQGNQHGFECPCGVPRFVEHYHAGGIGGNGVAQGEPV